MLLLAVCGPTAVGKSALADDLAGESGGVLGSRTPVVVVDSVQVYEGLSEITNQARGRPAELVGEVPVTERWTVARHRDAADALISAQDGPTGGFAVLDAGTGMYLNAILLDLRLAPEVPEEVRRRATLAASGEENPRRAARELELRMVGEGERRSVWDGALRRDTVLVYLRPERRVMDDAISRRSARILERGVDEAQALKGLRDGGVPINPSVLDAIGVKELLAHVEGDLDAQSCREKIEARTRRLGRRQMRWFDKLSRTLHGRTNVIVAENPADKRIKHTMHDRIGA